MPYPQHYVGCYPALASWLKHTRGHSVYPMEMVCNSVVHPRNCFVDVVSFFNGNLYAWEYKSRRDNIKRAIKQVENYCKSFNYVCVVAANINALMQHREFFQSLGVGLYYNEKDGFSQLDEEKPQTPHPKLNEDLINRFKRYVYKREAFSKPKDKSQTSLLQFRVARFKR